MLAAPRPLSNGAVGCFTFGSQTVCIGVRSVCKMVWGYLLASLRSLFLSLFCLDWPRLRLAQAVACTPPSPVWFSLLSHVHICSRSSCSLFFSSSWSASHVKTGLLQLQIEVFLKTISRPLGWPSRCVPGSSSLTWRVYGTCLGHGVHVCRTCLGHGVHNADKNDTLHTSSSFFFGCYL